MNDFSNWPDYNSFKSLYSADPTERLCASTQFEKAENIPCFKWPHGCWGAANAWLVLLGPSPGKPDKMETPATDDQNRRLWNSPAGIGSKAPQIRFNDGKRRNLAFKKISDAGFGTHSNKEMPQRLTALMNLDSKNSSSGDLIAQSDLSDGCPVIFERLLEAKPRIVIILSFAAWNPFSDFLKNKRAETLSLPFVYPNERALLGLKLKLAPEFDFSTLFVKSRQHPSMPFFKIGVDDEAIRKTVDWFLDQSN